MKRLLAIAALAVPLAIGAFSPAAHAATVSCVQVGGTGPYWPGGLWTQDCTGVVNSPAGNSLFNGLNNSYTGGQLGVLATYMKGVNAKYPYAGRFYVFNTSADFETYAKANFGGNPKAKPPIPATPYPTSLDAGVFGFSYHDPSAPTSAPIYTAVFVKPTATLTNKTIQKVTAHEAGHYLDWLYGAKIKATNVVSNTLFYQHELAYDWSLFNLRKGCVSGGSGIFNAHTDLSGQVTDGLEGTEICTDLGTPVPNGNGGALNPPYNNKNYTTNQLVLLNAWPYVYKYGSKPTPELPKGNTAYPLIELFAETYSTGIILAGNNDNAYDPSEQDVYLNAQSNFPCTQALIQYILLNGAVPAPPPAPAPNGFTGYNPDGSKYSCPRS